MPKWTVLLGSILLIGCQTPMYTGSQCVLEPGSLAAMQSYSWKDGQTINVDDQTGFVSPLVAGQLKAAIDGELTAKGFRVVDSEESPPDLELAVSLRARRELVSYQTGGQVCADSACWERANTNASMRTETRTVGFIAADMYLEGEPVWRGWVETSLYRDDRDDPGEVMGRAIPKLFETFPP